MSSSHRRRSEPFCFTVKQWALCVSLVLLVISIVFTVCSILAKIHTDSAWDRLNADIEEEKAKSYYEGYLSPNEALLHSSRQSVSFYKWLVFVAIVIGSLNVLSLSINLYGIIYDLHAAMLPWLLIGALSYTFVGLFMFAIHDRLVPGLYIDMVTLVYFLSGYFFFLPCWCITYYHFTILKERSIKMSHLPTSKSVIGKGGYIHTFNSTSKNSPKSLVV